MTDDLTNWRTDLTRNITRQLDVVETRLTAVRSALQRAGQGAYVTPNTELLASEVLQLVLLAANLDQLIDIEKENQT